MPYSCAGRGWASWLVRSPTNAGAVARRPLDGVAEVAGFGGGGIRTEVFRHTFCAAALQLLDRGAPVSPWTVAQWMGHGGHSRVHRVYGHLGDVRHRSERAW